MNGPENWRNPSIPSRDRKRLSATEDVDLAPEYAAALTPDGNGNGWKSE